MRRSKERNKIHMSSHGGGQRRRTRLQNRTDGTARTIPGLVEREEHAQLFSQLFHPLRSLRKNGCIGPLRFQHRCSGAGAPRVPSAPNTHGPSTAARTVLSHSWQPAELRFRNTNDRKETVMSNVLQYNENFKRFTGDLPPAAGLWP